MEKMIVKNVVEDAVVALAGEDAQVAVSKPLRGAGGGVRSKRWAGGLAYKYCNIKAQNERTVPNQASCITPE